MRRNSTPKAKSLRANRGGTRKSGQRGSMKADPALQLRPEYRGEPCVALKLNRSPLVQITTVTTGAVAVDLPIRSADIPTFSTRFAAWKEWRIVKTVCRLKCLSSTATGIMNMWFDNQAYAPTSSLSQNERALRVNVSSVDREHTLTYTPHDVDEQAWTAVGTDFTSGYIKLFTNTADYGAPIVVTSVTLLDVLHTVQFRGFV